MVHVVVTGAASGIGRAIVGEFVSAGSDVTLVDVDQPGMDRTAAEHVVQAHARTIETDLAHPGESERMIDIAWDSGGPVDVLINAAGIYPSLDMLDVTADQWDRVFALNVRAPVLATKQLARLAIRENRPASAVNISSGAALRSRPGGGPYASSKAALEMATRADAMELGPHRIRVNAVSPGFVPVDSSCNLVADDYAAVVSKNPLGRPGTPYDVARAVRWISSEQASWITGEVLRVDGGSNTGAAHLPHLWPPEGDDAAPHEAQTYTPERTS